MSVNLGTVLFLALTTKYTEIDRKHFNPIETIYLKISEHSN
jgi:hypothetical protein